MGQPLVRTFSHHCRQRYGAAVGKLPLDVGLSCPNRRQGGCIFCRPASFTPHYLCAEDSIDVQIAKGKQQLLKGRFRRYFGYFQQETVTALASHKLLPLLSSVLDDPSCCGLILSTRPDYLSEPLLTRLARLVQSREKECLLELGLQSIHARSLGLLNRNHSLEDFHTALERIRRHAHLSVGVHLILGIPGESTGDMIESIRLVCRLGIDALKLHHLQVIRGTPLHTMYRKGEVRVFTLQEYMDVLLQLLPVIPADVTLHRLWSTAHPSLLVAPRWQVLTGELSAMLQHRLAEQGLSQGCFACYPPMVSSKER